MLRFGGRLQADLSVEDFLETSAMVEAGEVVRPARCDRVWLRAHDSQEEVGSRHLAAHLQSARGSGGTLRPGKCSTWRLFGPPDRYVLVRTDCGI